MRHISPLLALASATLLPGCSGEDKAGDTGNIPIERCLIEVDGASPVQGATDHYYRDPIEFHLSGSDPTATVSGLAGTTSISADGETITFTPDTLEPSTSYTVTLEWCAGTVDLSFTTSALGEEMPDPAVLSGGTYSLDLRDARILEPEGLGSVITSMLETAMLLGVTGLDVEAGSVALAMGIAQGDLVSQDLCEPTIGLPTASLDAPDFAIPPQDATLAVAGGAVPIRGFSLTGTFAADGSYLGGGALSGSLDARDIAAAFPDLGYTAQEFCELMAGFGAICAACDDGEPLCATLVADQITAARVGGTLVEVAAADCPGCDAGEPVCE